MTTFIAHGEYSIRTCGRAIRVDAWGPWNVECTVNYAAALTKCMGAMPKPFGMMMVSHIQPILGQESEAVLQQNVRERVKMGCAAQATVLLDVSTVGVAKAQYRRVYVPEGLRYAIFYDTISAAAWLVSKGFSDFKALHRREAQVEPQASIGDG